MFEFMLVLLGIAFGALVVLYFTRRSKASHVRTEGQLLLESTRKICKLAAVEGEFSEIYSKSDTASYFFDLFSSEKKALVIVKAKAILGFDLNKMILEVDESNKILHIRHFPSPQLISLETDCQYYDLKHGSFNKFSPEDLTKMQIEAKDLIKNKIEHSQLPTLAVEQAKDAISLVRHAALASGWNVQTAPNIGADPNQPKLLLN